MANIDAVAGIIPANDGEAHMDQLLYTIGQCCQMAAIGRTTLYELIARGELRIRKVGRKSLIAAADLKRWADRLPATEARGPNRPSVKVRHRELAR